MLPETGATELIFLAIVALIVVGPKDLPVLLRKVGQFTSKMRGLAAEFRASFDELARQSELDELRKEVEAIRTGQHMQPLTQEISEHKRDIDEHFDALHREFGAQPPPRLTDEGVVIPGPGALPAPQASASPEPVSAAPPPAEAISHPAAPPPAEAVRADPAREAAG